MPESPARKTFRLIFCRFIFSSINRSKPTSDTKPQSLKVKFFFLKTNPKIFFVSSRLRVGLVCLFSHPRDGRDRVHQVTMGGLQKQLGLLNPAVGVLGTGVR